MKMRFYPLTVLAALVIWVGCLWPAESIEVPVDFPGWDKLVHSALFLVLSLTFWVERRFAKTENKVQRLWLWALVVPILMGGAIEFAQAFFTETRSGDWWDLAADALGVVLAWPVGKVINKNDKEILNAKG